VKLLSEAVAETPLTLNVRRHNTEGRLKLMKKGHVSVASKDVAFYYPGPFWYSAAWVKNLLLFFDGIALLVPTYMKNRPSVLEPEMAISLTKAGLLHILEPEVLVDKQATEQLAMSLTDIITSIIR